MTSSTLIFYSAIYNVKFIPYSAFYNLIYLSFHVYKFDLSPIYFFHMSAEFLNCIWNCTGHMILATVKCPTLLILILYVNSGLVSIN